MTWLGTGQFQWSIGTNATIGANGKAPYSNGSIGEYLSHSGDLDYFLRWSSWVQGNSNGPLVPVVQLAPVEKHPIQMVLLVQNKFSFTPSSYT